MEYMVHAFLMFVPLFLAYLVIISTAKWYTKLSWTPFMIFVFLLILNQ